MTIDKSADHGNAPGILCAFNAETLEELWNSEQNPSRDRLGTLVKSAEHSEWQGVHGDLRQPDRCLRLEGR